MTQIRNALGSLVLVLYAIALFPAPGLAQGKKKPGVGTTPVGVASIPTCAGTPEGCPNTQPQVTITSVSGQIVDGTRTASFRYCDDWGLGNPSASLNGTALTLNVVSSSGCKATKTATATLIMPFGVSTLSTTICDIYQSYLTPTGPYCTTATQQLEYRTVDVIARTATPTRIPTNQTGQAAVFRVQNIGPSTRSYILTPVCSNTGVSGCSVSVGSVTLAPNDTASATVTFNTASEGTSGSVGLKAAESMQSANASTAAIAVNVGWGAGKPLISTAPTGGTRFSPGLCVQDCFDIATAYATTAYYSLDTPQSVAITYRGQRANPRAIIQLDVQDTSAIRASQVSVRMVRSNGSNVVFANGQQELYYQGSPNVRVTVMDTVALATGFYPFKVVVTSRWPDGITRQDSTTVSVLVNNGQSSPYGAGWDVAGIERLYPFGSTDVLLVAGDGTLARYTNINCVAGSTCTFTPPLSDWSNLKRLATDSSGVRWTRTYRNGQVVTYDASGFMRQVRNRNGNAISVEYVADGTGRVSRVVDPMGRSFTFTYALANAPKPNSLRSITDDMGRQTLFDIDLSNDLVRVTDAAGIAALSATYAGHRLRTTIDRRGGSWDITVAGDGTLKTTLAPAVTVKGVMTRLLKSQASATAAFFDSVAAGAGTAQRPLPAVAPDSVLARAIDAGGHVTKYLLNRYGEAMRVDGPRGEHVTTVYDQNGLATSLTGPNLSITTVYNVGGTLNTVTGAGVTTDYTYGAYDLLTRVVGGGGQVDYAYDSTYKCLVSAMVGLTATKVTKYSCDNRGRVTTVTDPEGHLTRFDYDAVTGNMSHFAAQSDTTLPANRDSYTYYDQYGRDTLTIDPAGAPTRVYRDLINRDTLAVAPKGLTVATHYDSLFVREVIVAGTQRYKYATNALGWVDSTTDTTGTRSNVYDSTGNVVAIRNKRGQLTTYTLDIYGRVTRKQLVDGRVTTFAYDSLDRWTADSSAESVDTVFANSARQITLVRSRRGGRVYDINYSYMGTGQRLTLQFSRDGSVPVSGASRFYYDSSGIVPNNGLLYGLSESATSSRIVGLVHNADGLATRRTFPASTGLVLDQTFTANDHISAARLNLSGADADFGRNYAWDKVERITRRANGGQTAGRVFQYDSLGRVVGIQDEAYAAGTCHPVVNVGMVCSSGSTTVTATSLLSYDVLGNRADSGAVVAPGNRLTAFRTMTMDYDLDGNLWHRTDGTGTNRFVWNSENQLDSVQTPTGMIAYGYDAYGTRIRKTVNGVTTRYVYDGNQLYVETDSAGNVARLYRYFGQTDNPAYVVLGDGSIYHYLQDESANVIGLVNNAGQSVAKYVYSPFGGLEAGSFDSIPGGGNKLRFKGRMYDPEIGLYENRARYYDPASGRFASEDPLGPTGGVNPYSFANNDPVNGADPSGLSVEAAYCISWYEVTTDLTTGKVISSHFLYQECFGGGGGGGSGGEGGGPKTKTLKEKMCKALPDGRTIGVQGGVGGVSAATGGGEIVRNYNTGQTSLFGFVGEQAGWNGALSVTGTSGYIRGLSGDNGNYSGGFTTFSLSAGAPGEPGAGVFYAQTSGGLTHGISGMKPSSGVKVLGVSVNLALAGRYGAGASASQYSAPFDLGKFSGWGLSDLAMYAAKQAFCH